MAVSLHVDIKGAKETTNAFNKSGEIINDKFNRNLQRVAINIESKAKAYAPRDTGLLKRSIGTKHSSGSGNIRYSVGTNLHYAPYQEFGTSRGVPAVRYLGRAVDETRNMVDGALRDSIGEVILGLSRK